MTGPSTAPWLERMVQACLGAESHDTRLGDLAEQYARTLQRGHESVGAGLSCVVAGLHYAAAAANVVLFARIVDPGLRLAEDGTVGHLAIELRERLMNTLRKLAMPAVLLACSAFLVFSAVGVWQDWRRNEALLQAQQRDKAEALVQRVEAFMGDIQRQVGWVSQAQWGSQPVQQQRFDYVRLLRQTMPITELAYLDGKGLEQLHVSRLAMDVVGEGKDRSAEAVFSEAKSGRAYFGPVFFRKASEPYLDMAVAHGGRSGVTVASLNLKPIWDAVREAKVGEAGYAYIVDGQGRLILHPDMALVLRGTDMKSLPHVAAAFAPAGNDQVLVGDNRNGVEVWSVQAPVASLNWRVFVERPVAETRAAFWLAVGRGLGLLLLGLVAAWFAFRLGMRSAEPLRTASA
jgi:hypothetical protein